MGFLGKLQFWKKHDEFTPGMDQNLGMPEMDKAYDPTMQWSPPPPLNPSGQQFASPTFSTPSPFSQSPMQQSFSQPSYQASPSSDRRDLELIEAKLDTIKSLLDNLNQRLSNIERLAKE